MAMHKCSTPGCTSQAAGRNIFCAKCWAFIPESHRRAIRAGTEKGEHTLRAHPTHEWMSRAIRFAQTKKS